MKTKIILLAVVALALLESCASHCGNKSYRTKRFVQNEAPTPIQQIPV